MDNDTTTRQIPYYQKKVGDLRVIELFIVLLIIWVLVELWVIFFRGISKSAFGLNEKNPVHAFAFAFAVTAILLGFIILAGDDTEEVLVNVGAVPSYPDVTLNTGMPGMPGISEQEPTQPNLDEYVSPDEVLSFVDKGYNKWNISNKSEKKKRKKLIKYII